MGVDSPGCRPFAQAAVQGVATCGVAFCSVIRGNAPDHASLQIHPPVGLELYSPGPVEAMDQNHNSASLPRASRCRATSSADVACAETFTVVPQRRPALSSLHIDTPYTAALSSLDIARLTG